jgi:hypothetical protein
MTEAEWLACEDPTPMLEFLRGKASDRKLRLIAVACCQRAKPFMEEDKHELADIAEAYAEGLVSVEVLNAVHARHYRPNNHPMRDAFSYTAALDIRESLPYLVEDLADGIASCKVDDTGRTFEEWENEKAVAFRSESALTSAQVRDIIGNPFRPVAFDAAWRTPTAVALSGQMYESRDFTAMPILADALQDAGCDNEEVLRHCRDTSVTHVRGCWVVDLVLGKE